MIWAEGQPSDKKINAETGHVAHDFPDVLAIIPDLSTALRFTPHVAASQLVGATSPLFIKDGRMMLVTTKKDVRTWGTIGELEVLKHLEEGRPVVDSRTPDFYEKSTIPGTKNIPYPEATTRMEELDGEHPTISFAMVPNAGNRQPPYELCWMQATNLKRFSIIVAVCTTG